MSNSERHEESVLFGLDADGVPDEVRRMATPKQGLVNEILIECPVVIEFVGAGLSTVVRDQVVQMIMAQLQGALAQA